MHGSDEVVVEDRVVQDYIRGKISELAETLDKVALVAGTYDFTRDSASFRTLNKINTYLMIPRYLEAFREGHVFKLPIMFTVDVIKGACPWLDKFADVLDQTLPALIQAQDRYISSHADLEEKMMSGLSLVDQVVMMTDSPLDDMRLARAQTAVLRTLAAHWVHTLDADNIHQYLPESLKSFEHGLRAAFDKFSDDLVRVGASSGAGDADLVPMTFSEARALLFILGDSWVKYTQKPAHAGAGVAEEDKKVGTEVPGPGTDTAGKSNKVFRVSEHPIDIKLPVNRNRMPDVFRDISVSASSGSKSVVVTLSHLPWQVLLVALPVMVAWEWITHSKSKKKHHLLKTQQHTQNGIDSTAQGMQEAYDAFSLLFKELDPAKRGESLSLLHGAISRVEKHMTAKKGKDGKKKKGDDFDGTIEKFYQRTIHANKHDLDDEYRYLRQIEPTLISWYNGNLAVLAEIKAKASVLALTDAELYARLAPESSDSAFVTHVLMMRAHQGAEHAASEMALDITSHVLENFPKCEDALSLQYNLQVGLDQKDKARKTLLLLEALDSESLEFKAKRLYLDLNLGEVSEKDFLSRLESLKKDLARIDDPAFKKDAKFQQYVEQAKRISSVMEALESAREILIASASGEKISAGVEAPLKHSFSAHACVARGPRPDYSVPEMFLEEEAPLTLTELTEAELKLSGVPKAGAGSEVDESLAEAEAGKRAQEAMVRTEIGIAKINLKKQMDELRVKGLWSADLEAICDQYVHDLDKCLVEPEHYELQYLEDQFQDQMEDTVVEIIKQQELAHRRGVAASVVVHAGARLGGALSVLAQTGSSVPNAFLLSREALLGYEAKSMAPVAGSLSSSAGSFYDATLAEALEKRKCLSLGT